MEGALNSCCIVGQVRTGLGQAAGFTALPWARREFLRHLGIEPFPGTLNLHLEPGAFPAWNQLTGTAGFRITPERSTDCGARCYPVHATASGHGPVTAGIVVPEVPGYAPGQVEVVAAVSLRDALGVDDGDFVTLSTVPARNRRAVLFDVDGTLVNSIDGYRLAAERAVRPYGWSVSAEAVSRALNFGDQFWDMVIPATARGDHELVAQLRRDTMAHWPAVLEEAVLVYPGIGPILATLKAAGVRLGICTASQGESFQPLERAGLLEYFEEIVTAQDVRHRKPDPEGILLCMERMGIGADETVYVGDTVADIRASHAAGLYAVGVLTGAGSSSLLSGAGAHRILPDLQHLPAVLFGGGLPAP